MNNGNVAVATHISPETLVSLLESIVDELQYYGDKEEYESIMLILEEHGFNFR